jgi:hypothetical protein
MPKNINKYLYIYISEIYILYHVSVVYMMGQLYKKFDLIHVK